MKCYKKSMNFPIFLIFLLLIIFSCNKTEKTDILADPDTKIESEVSDKTTLVFGENRKKQSSEQDSDTESKGFTEIEKGDIKGQLFSIDSIPVIPEDMLIGSLLNYNVSNPGPGSFPHSIISFFNDAGKGIINKDVLHPTWSKNIEKLYTNRLSEQYYTLRIGDITIKNGISSANIRLIGKTGRVSGSVTADSFEDRWLLSDISVDIVRLEEIYLRENLEFNPLSYSNILLNY